MGNGTSIGKVRGLGAAHEGAHHWFVQRFTAIGNLILSVWLIGSFLWLPDFSYDTVIGWLERPLSSTIMILFVVSTFWHARLGLQVVVEDYVHQPGSKFAALAALNLISVGSVVFAVFCITKIAIGGSI